MMRAGKVEARDKNPSMKIELSDRPLDYGLPFENWNTHQSSMCESAVNLPQGKTLFIQASTGAGKSGVPALVSHFRKGTTTCVATRDLQSQYSKLAPFMKTVWGRTHYPCSFLEYVAEFKSIYGVAPTRADCKFSKPSECPAFPCEYDAVKADALHARAKVFNYAYAFHARWWRPHANDLFCDEAHRLPVVLSDLISVEMRESIRGRNGLPAFPFAVGGTPFAIRQARQWCEQAASAILPLTKSKDIKKKRWAENKRGQLERLAGILYSADEAEWYIKSRPGDAFFARPVIPGEFAASLLIPEARSHVLMSATIGSPAVLAAELGIDDYEFVTYPHIFPPENRRVFLVDGSPKLSYKSTDADYETQFQLINRVLNRHKGQRGIIHCMSYKHAEKIAAAISHNGRDVVVPSGERVASIQRFYDSAPGTVVVTPSWHEGLNLEDERARFAIVAKCPYLSLADPVTKLRLKRKGGNAWYQWIAALGVVQSCGRVVRHTEDWAVSYIVDANWRRCAKYAPSWFEWSTLAV